MQKDKKSKLAIKQNKNKGVLKVAEQNPKQKKQQQEKLKKAVAGAVEAKTGSGKKQNSKKKPQKVVVVPESESEEEEIEAPESEDEQMESEQEDAESDQENVESEEEDEEEDDDDDDDDDDDNEDSDQEDEDAESDAQEQEEPQDDETNQIGVGNTIFLSYVPNYTKRAEIVKAFTPFGNVLAVIFKFKTYYLSNGVDKIGVRALVVLDSQEAVEKALAKSNVVLNNRTVALKKHQETITSKNNVSNENNTVFVSDMSASSTPSSLRKILSNCGEITFINFLKGHEGKAFVCFKDPSSVSLALKLNGDIFDGKPIKISKYSYKPKEKVNKALNKKVFVDKAKKGNKKNELKGVEKTSKTIKKTPKKKVVSKE